MGAIKSLKLATFDGEKDPKSLGVDGKHKSVAQVRFAPFIWHDVERGHDVNTYFPYKFPEASAA